jgi:hypothetical protein
MVWCRSLRNISWTQNSKDLGHHKLRVLEVFNYLNGVLMNIVDAVRRYGASPKKVPTEALSLASLPDDYKNLKIRQSPESAT